MSEHLDLFGLLRGELGNADTIAAGDHLATCASCQEELADAVVGHALLARASRTLGPVADTQQPGAAHRAVVRVAGAAAPSSPWPPRSWWPCGITGALWWRSERRHLGRRDRGDPHSPFGG